MQLGGYETSRNKHFSEWLNKLKIKYLIFQLTVRVIDFLNLINLLDRAADLKFNLVMLWFFEYLKERNLNVSGYD